MRIHHLAACLVVPLVAALLTLGGAASTRAAAGHPAAAPRAMSAASLTNKAILPDTSIDGPALASVDNETVLGWTGTDAAHHLNVETSMDGLHYGDKRTLNETSPFRPDVALTRPGGAVAIAWTGSDTNHSLNVLLDVYGSSPKKLTLRNENSFTAPALLLGPGFYLAWTGTDTNHSLNIMSIGETSTGLQPGTKTILSKNSSDAGPNLARGSATVIDLSWTSRTRQLMIASGDDPVFLQPGTGLPETSAAAPSTNFLGRVLGAENQIWIGWTGTDAAHHLNLEGSTGNLPGAKTILADTAIGGPALSFNTSGNTNLLAWTGTDAAHHLNIATFV